MIYSSTDWGMTWRSTTVGVQGDSEESGLFSVDFFDDHDGIVVGGNYDGDSLTSAEGDNAAITEDGGDTWHVMEEQHAPGISLHYIRAGYLRCKTSFPCPGPYIRVITSTEK